MENQVLKSKVVFVGDQSVGKTSIINRFIFDNFTGNEQPTVGVDFVSKTVQIENKTLRIQLWDTAGQERFHSLIPSYIKDSSAAIIVYDITNNNSFQNVVTWLDRIKDVRGDDVGVFVFGNKSDLDHQRTISIQQSKNKFKQLGLQYYQGSAKTGYGIKQFFKQLTYKLAGSKGQNKDNTISDNNRKPDIILPSKTGGTTLTNHNNNQIKKSKSCSC